MYDERSSFKNETKDASILAKFIKNKYKPVIVKDSYRFSFKWEKYLSKYSKYMIVIDDECNTDHFADYYINYNPHLVSKKNNLINKIKIKIRKMYFFTRTRFFIIQLPYK